MIWSKKIWIFLSWQEYVLGSHNQDRIPDEEAGLWRRSAQQPLGGHSSSLCCHVSHTVSRCYSHYLHVHYAAQKYIKVGLIYKQWNSCVKLVQPSQLRCKLVLYRLVKSRIWIYFEKLLDMKKVVVSKIKDQNLLQALYTFLRVLVGFFCYMSTQCQDR